MKTLSTNRLFLRPFQLDDAAEVQRLAGDRRVAETTATIPHPYEDGMAEDWIGQHSEWAERGSDFVFALEELETKSLVGCMNISLCSSHQKAEVGYWISAEHWGRGYCTEALATVIQFGFEELQLNRIEAHHLSSNGASGRVMQKCGMKHEGTLRQAFIKWGKVNDIVYYGLLKQDWVTR